MGKISMSRNILMTAAAVAVSCVPAIVGAQARIEVLPVQSATLNTQQFLTGNVNDGKATLLAGELRLPAVAGGKLPAVILVHGSGGMGATQVNWADELNSVGIAAFLLDSFSARGITSTVNDQSQLDSLAMMVDAYRALGMLARHPRIDPQRIGVMGFSKGAVAAVYSSNERFRKLYAPAGVPFAAHIGLYTPCNVTYRDDEKVTGKPIRLFHGIADDYVSIGPCRTYVTRLAKSGVDITLTEYEGAHHAYDSPGLRGAEPAQLPQAQTTRNCQLSEGERGAILNVKSGKAYRLDDSCVEKGPHIGYNEAAAVAAVKAVKEFLSRTFGVTGRTP